MWGDTLERIVVYAEESGLLWVQEDSFELDKRVDETRRYEREAIERQVELDECRTVGERVRMNEADLVGTKIKVLEAAEVAERRRVQTCDVVVRQVENLQQSATQRLQGILVHHVQPIGAQIEVRNVQVCEEVSGQLGQIEVRQIDRKHASSIAIFPDSKG